MLGEYLATLSESYPEILGFEDRIEEFYKALVRENEVQNLTRLTSPLDFINGHLVDCIELLRSGFLGEMNIDLGSGGGVPGVLTYLIDNQAKKWLLVDSEGSKAEFLERTIQEMNIGSGVSAKKARIETILGRTIPKENEKFSVVARAVGPITRIFSWISNCSTWNNLILLKGPGWSEEFQTFQKAFGRSAIQVTGEHHYKTPDQKTRIIVKLSR